MKILFILLASTLSLNVLANDYFPTQTWKTRTLEEAGFNKEKFQTLVNYVWENTGAHKTDAFIIIKDGYLVYEGYDRGFNTTKKHMFWSFSKSLTNILMGIAIRKEHVSLNTPIKKYYPQMKKEHAKDVQLHHVLNMSSGIKYWEENPVNIALSDSISVHYSKKAFKDVANNVVNRKWKHSPGKQFNYGTHEPMIAMGVLKKAINNKEIYNNFPWVELFDKLGMKNVAFEQDLSGTFLGGAGGWGNAREYAKLGLLMLNDGVWDGERILPEGWVDWSTKRIAPALFIPTKEKGQSRLNIESYGSYWWLNKKLPMNKQRPYPSAPNDLYQAMGFRGQTMGIIPSKNLIVVRMASDGRKPKKKLKRDKLYKLLLSSLVEGK